MQIRAAMLFTFYFWTHSVTFVNNGNYEQAKMMTASKQVEFVKKIFRLISDYRRRIKSKRLLLNQGELSQRHLINHRRRKVLHRRKNSNKNRSENNFRAKNDDSGKKVVSDSSQALCLYFLHFTSVSCRLKMNMFPNFFYSGDVHLSIFYFFLFLFHPFPFPRGKQYWHVDKWRYRYIYWMCID